MKIEKELSEINKTLKAILEEMKRQKGIEPVIPIAELLEMAKKIVIKKQRASATLLQKELEIGYPKASNLMDLLEKERVIGAHNGSAPRKVLIKK